MKILIVPRALLYGSIFQDVKHVIPLRRVQIGAFLLFGLIHKLLLGVVDNYTFELTSLMVLLISFI